METKIAIFKTKEIRKRIFNNEWWFVVEDVVFALTDSVNVKDYIKKMRLRDEELAKGWGQFVTPLEIETKGGVQKINCADTTKSGSVYAIDMRGYIRYAILLRYGYVY